MSSTSKFKAKQICTPKIKVQQILHFSQIKGNHVLHFEDQRPMCPTLQESKSSMSCTSRVKDQQMLHLKDQSLANPASQGSKSNKSCSRFWLWFSKDMLEPCLSSGEEHSLGAENGSWMLLATELWLDTPGV